ncbi:MAG: formate--tetrahydrofolate ligase [Candidatus Omnitrophota bacterium]
MNQKPKPIRSIARSLGIRDRELELNGNHKAKIDLSILERLKPRRARYVLVSAVTPTPLGEGKTVTTIGLSMALNRLGVKSACTLRQSSLGPLFGSKGMATGGGRSQVIPFDEINLHFTGDMHAVAEANNLLSAFLENSIFHGNPLRIDPDSILWKRCLDISDRSLRRIRYTLKMEGASREMASGFEVTAASELMSILALSRDRADLRSRLKEIVVGRDASGALVRSRDLKADGMMAAVLTDAIKPNLVQTCEHTPCLVHAGPFANISIGTSSILADRIALGLSDYVVTESGFGVDCGGEKFFDIKCRVAGFQPDACVLVCSLRGLKAQSRKITVTPGERMPQGLFQEDQEALEQGIVNLRKHIENVRLFNIPVLVCVNVFPQDTEAELAFVRQKAGDFGARDCCLSRMWEEGSAGGLDLARSLLEITRSRAEGFRYLYEDNLSLEKKIEMIASKIYGAASVDFSPQSRQMLAFYEEAGFGRLPVCIAKTQFSLSHDESLKGAPRGFVFPVKDVRLQAGAGFVLAHASLMQTMPGLPRHPRGEQVDVSATGEVTGL